TRSLKMRGELTIAACSGFANGTLITSIRNSAEFGSSLGFMREQPASSLGERTPADPEMYTYTSAGSLGSTNTVCVCDPRHVCTFAMYFGFAISEMSKMRRPRTRSLLTVSFTPPPPQSSRPPWPSADTNRRFLYVDTSLCDAGQ